MRSALAASCQWHPKTRAWRKATWDFKFNFRKPQKEDEQTMTLSIHESVMPHRDGFSRRRFLHGVAAGTLAAGAINLRDLMTLQAAELKKQGRSMILLWMAGGPSQFETFDPKPGTDNGGPTQAIDTTVPGIQIAEGWERTAQVMEDVAIIRSMTNREGSHPRASYQLHTGYIPSGSVKHPSLAASIAKEIADPALDLPPVVTVGGRQPFGGIGAGFLGVDYEPFMVSTPGQLPDNVRVPVPESRFERRLGLLEELEGEFASRGGGAVVKDHQRLYEKTSKMVLSDETQAFNLSEEPSSLASQYGNSPFGRGCLLARRLVEAGVTFVEVVSGGWDTHQDNFAGIKRLAGGVDPGFASLVSDLKSRGQLDRTLVVWMGEFGRTPRVNPRTGRDHYPRVFNVAMAGGGIRGGQVIGSSTADGSAVQDNPITVPDLFTSICKSLHVDPAKENISPLGRPMKIVDGGNPIAQLFG
jgi:hypothetical protein